MTTSRYARPPGVLPLVLQSRDIAIMRSLFRHRWLRAEHVRMLHFPAASARATRQRLRRLWLARFIDRAWLTLVVGRGVEREAYAGSAIYCLAHRGADIVADELGIEPTEIPATLKANHRGYANMRHNLVATDFFVALEAAAKLNGTAPTPQVERESELWRILGTWLSRRTQKGDYIVPDGAVTFVPISPGARPMTFYLEVVRVDPKGGGAALIAKLAKYATLNRQGFCRDVWGHARLRAVIILTPTDARAENLRARADRTLSAGRNLFWFGSYERTNHDGRRAGVFTPTSVIEPRFFSVDAKPQSIKQAITS